MWAVTPTFDEYGNMLVGLSKKERMTLQGQEMREAAKDRLAAPRVQTMSHKALKAFVRGGIPKSQRLHVWMELSGANQLRAAHPIDHFGSLSQGIQSAGLVHSVETCVSKWMPGHRLLSSKGALREIARIVQASRQHNKAQPEETLCVLAAFLVMVLGDGESEACFWLLAALQLKLGTQVPGSQGQVQSRVLATLAEKRLPRLCAHLDQISFSLANETGHWFSLLFVGSLPAPTVIRIWDVALFEGPKILYRVALALLKRLDVQSLSWASIMTWRISRTFDADLLMKDVYDLQAACKGLGSFPSSDIQKVQSECDEQSRQILTNHSRRLEALLCHTN